MQMKKSLKRPAALLLGLLSLIASQQAAISAPAKIVVADAKTTHHLNLYVAQELGIFKKHKLDVSIVPVADLAAARDLVVSGQADVFWSCPTVAIAAIANGAPIKIISQVKKPCTSVLLVPKDSPITRLSDLKGKNIAGISPTCESVIALTVAARKNGGQFNLQKLAGGPALAALEARQVDGAILEEPQASIAELKGYKVLFKDAAENIPCRTINARNTFLKSNAKELKTFIRAIGEANALILSNPVAPNIVDIAVKYTGAPVEAIKYGNHRLKFRTTIDQPGLFLLGNELIELQNIRENPGNRLYAEEFRGITWR
ncbi:ABC transporter substrate-binding protein [Chlorobium sp. KB01]|uniref:ABC transporter substrate-binding protein n=1 Tax=Chlorobium sp. KB01 TaxID=1917528 RepID=UPI0009F84DED|nr:ABC transporter substrate-binding protein [Chlorobium sp. KB01]